MIVQRKLLGVHIIADFYERKIPEKNVLGAQSAESYKFVMHFFESKQEYLGYEQGIFLLQEAIVLNNFVEAADCSVFVEESYIAPFKDYWVEDQNEKGVFDVSEDLDEPVILRKDMHKKVSFGDPIVDFVLG